MRTRNGPNAQDAQCRSFRVQLRCSRGKAPDRNTKHGRGATIVASLLDEITNHLSVSGMTGESATRIAGRRPPLSVDRRLARRLCVRLPGRRAVFFGDPPITSVGARDVRAQAHNRRRQEIAGSSASSSASATRQPRSRGRPDTRGSTDGRVLTGRRRDSSADALHAPQGLTRSSCEQIGREHQVPTVANLLDDAEDSRLE